jgi:uncharacterized protein (TIGR02265 family)
LTPAQYLRGTLDGEATARNIPSSFLVKGMFFARVVSQLGDGYANVVPQLAAPPRLGRYVPFSDYPQADYVRLSVAAAAKLYPNVPLREGLRRLGRDDFGVLATSTIGKVTLAAVGDARSVLLKAAYIYESLSRGWKVTGEALDASTVRITFAPVYGTWEYTLGQLEGVVLNFGGTPTTTVNELPGRTVQFDVRHDP